MSDVARGAGGLASPDVEEADWWRAYLHGAPDQVDLPFDRSRPTQLGPDRQVVTVAIDPRIGRTTLLTAVSALQYRQSGEEDVVVGVASDDGLRPIRVSVEAGTTVAMLEQSVVAALDEVLTHDAPDLDALARALGSEPDRSRAPVVQLVVGSVSLETAGVPVDLAVSLTSDGGGALLQWAYHPDLFTETTVGRMAGRLSRVVDQILDDATTTIADLELLDDAERQFLLTDLNATATKYVPSTLVARFLEQVRLRPEARAVDRGAATLTYAQLEQRSAQLATHLGSIGVRPGDRVGVFCDRSTDLLVALFGVMRSGAAYVPADPGYPADRIAYMLEDARVAAVVTEAGLESGLPELDAPVVRIDTDWTAIASSARGFVEVTVDPSDLAYVIYTSGSTGRPKGVMLEHAGVVNLLDEMAVRPGLAPGEVMVGLTTPAFDLSVPDLFLPLVTGATLVLAPAEDARDPRAITRLLDEVGANLVQATPATWRMLCESDWSGRPGLRTVCGGEGYGADLAATLLDRVSEVWNFYGPTETTVWSVCTQLHADVTDPVPMGRPIANTTCYILDEQRRPQPLGVPGELYIGGIGLARGYLGRPDLTDERFVPDPFTDGTGGRMYRTGDLVRQREDGTLIFIGRTDHQVKLRGFRIELGEIETALTAQPGIAQAVVTMREDHPGDRRLVAYVVWASADPFDDAALTDELRLHLPAYMVPSAFVALTEFPLTPNGKLDRKALPVPEHRVATFASVPPRDAREAELLALGHEVLGTDTFGVTDDFFDVGFDSIMAARLFTRIERTFGVELPLATVFQAPTVAGLAALLGDGSALERGTALSALVPIAGGGSAPAFFGVHGGAGTSLLYRPLARQMGDQRPFYGIQAVGLYGRESPQTSVEDMASRYIAEIKSVQPSGPYALGGYCFGGLVAYEMAAQLLARGDEVALVAMFNAPSATYNQRFNPVFDNEGALTDDQGSLKPRVDRSLRGSIERQVRETAGLRLPQRCAAIVRALTERVSTPIGAMYHRAEVVLAVQLHRPLPDHLREANIFQRIAKGAQDRYTPPRVDVPIVVYRAEGLYHEPALGWDEYSTAVIDCVEVCGDQPVPRRTMREPWVTQISYHLMPLLDQRLADGPTATDTANKTGHPTPDPSAQEPARSS
ncbi:MAG TPA: amino acid adenylation domain-containing protein [Acidimicrobiales bacterium]